MVDGVVGSLVGCLVGEGREGEVGSLVGWLVGCRWLSQRLVGWMLVGCLVGWLQVGWLQVGWLVGWMFVWLADCLAGYLSAGPTYPAIIVSNSCTPFRCMFFVDLFCMPNHSIQPICIFKFGRHSSRNKTRVLKLNLRTVLCDENA